MYTASGPLYSWRSAQTTSSYTAANSNTTSAYSAADPADDCTTNAANNAAAHSATSTYSSTPRTSTTDTQAASLVEFCRNMAGCPWRGEAACRKHLIGCVCVHGRGGG